MLVENGGQVVPDLSRCLGIEWAVAEGGSAQTRDQVSRRTSERGPLGVLSLVLGPVALFLAEQLGNNQLVTACLCHCQQYALGEWLHSWSC